MAGRVDPRDAPVLLSAIPNIAQSLKGVYNKDTDSNDKITVANEIIQYQGDLPGLKNGTTVSNPRSMSDGVYDSQEWISNNILASDWYTVATLAVGAGLPSSCRLVSTFGNGSIVLEVNKVSGNQHLEIVSLENSGLGNDILGARISTDDTGLGTIVQVNVLTNTNTLPLLTQIFSSGRALAGVASERFKLIEPVASELLPGGGTSSTFLEAGAERLLSTGTSFYPKGFTARVESANDVFCDVSWDQITKQGTVVTLTLPTTLFQFRQGTTSGVVTGAHNISNPVFSKYGVSFRLSETGAFSTLTAGAIAFPEISGTGCKLGII